MPGGATNTMSILASKVKSSMALNWDSSEPNVVVNTAYWTRLDLPRHGWIKAWQDTPRKKPTQEFRMAS